MKLHLKDLMPVVPKTPLQEEALSLLLNSELCVLRGCAGTGKTFLAMYAAFRRLLERDLGYDQIIVVRSAVPVRDMGFLPGSLEEKSEAYALPYIGICKELFGLGKESGSGAWKEGTLVTTSYIRGITLDNCLVIVDEAQNMTFSELDAIITRMGVNSSIVFCGDEVQADIRGSGFNKFCSLISGFSGSVTFSVDDIVRSDLVKDYIIARESYAGA